ncbi:hypothetical protein ACFX16_042813 [Malus domestica]
MVASLTILRLLRTPKSLIFSTIIVAAAPKTSLFTPKSFFSKISYTPLTQKPSSVSRLPSSNPSPPPSPSTTKCPEATLSYLDACFMIGYQVLLLSDGNGDFMRAIGDFMAGLL